MYIKFTNMNYIKTTRTMPTPLRTSFFPQCLFSLVLLLVLLFSSSNATTQTALVKKLAHNTSVSAVFVFGDSTSDPGNNNYILTPFKANFLPYGRDFPNQNPTGRFSNGFLSSDFVSKYVGLKESVPPYLDPSLSIEELMTGVSFASAASGYDPITPTISNVISLQKQLEYFKEYQERLESAIGKNKMKEVIRNGLYIVSAGTNDFVLNYFMLPVRRKTFTLPAYMDFLLKTQSSFLQNLWDLGARKMSVISLGPMGCLPIVITLYSDNAFLNRGCIEFFSSIARTYNGMLQNELNHMQFTLAKYGTRIAYTDTYGPLLDMVTSRDKYGFEEVNVGCCGSGYLETSFLCNPKSPVCPDASKYIFWDSIHPSEKTYYIVFKAMQSTIDSIIKD